MVKGDELWLTNGRANAQSFQYGPNGSWIRWSKRREDILPVRQHFARWSASIARKWGFDKATLIPIPNSCTTWEDDSVFRTADLADVIAATCPDVFTVARAIKFKQPLISSHSGGPRDRHLFAENMQVAPKFFPKAPIILLDDIKTSGAHLLAARDVLAVAGIATQAAIVCATTTAIQPADAFNLAAEDLDDLGFGIFFGNDEKA